MTHVDAGALLAMRDGALVDGDAVEHVRSCARCRADLADQGSRADAIAVALSALDAPVDLEQARAAVRRRLDAVRDRSHGGSAWRAHLGRAAAAVVLLSGVAYALPGSPLRAWLSPAAGSAPAVPTIAVSTAPQDVSDTGIRVTVPDGRITISISGATPGTTLEVRWIESATASISASPGSEFTFADGRAEARVAPGPVRVELPRLAPVLSVLVDGRPYLRRDGGPMEVLVPTSERSGEVISFVVDGGG